MSNRHIRRSGFTLVELLVVIAVIMILIALLIPAINLVQNKAHTASTRTQVTTLAVAMRAYADEDPRHCFPTPKSGSEFLVYDLTDPNSTLMLLERSGYRITSSDVDNTSGGASMHCLMDGWWRPLHYRLDGPFITAGGTLDSSAMNGTADKPAPLSDWNAKNVEPFTYIWSLGKPRSDDATDALPANASNWIYVQSTP